MTVLQFLSIQAWHASPGKTASDARRAKQTAANARVTSSRLKEPKRASLATPESTMRPRECFQVDARRVPDEPGIRTEDVLQHLAMDAVIAARPLAGREKRQVVEAVVGDCDTYMSHALGVTAELERQTVRAANETSGTARRHEALATKPGKDRPGSSQVGHGCAPSRIDPPP